MKYLHDSCLIVVEDGSITTRQKLMEEFDPLPAGYNGHINVIERKERLCKGLSSYQRPAPFY